MQKTPYIILVRPQLDENMGMVARAMMNCSLENLRIVKPRDNHLSDKAISASSGAEEILRNAIVFDSLEDAIKDLHQVFATTARRRDMTKFIYSPESAIKNVSENISNQKYGILFGAERTGLENDEVSVADAIIEIPLNPKHSSLNLSQAVLLIGYEWQKSQIEIVDKTLATNDSQTATKEELNSFLHFLENKLEDAGKFKNDEKKPRMLRNLQNIFNRSNITTQEIKTLYGVTKYLGKDI